MVFEIYDKHVRSHILPFQRKWLLEKNKNEIGYIILELYNMTIIDVFTTIISLGALVCVYFISALEITSWFPNSGYMPIFVFTCISLTTLGGIMRMNYTVENKDEAMAIIIPFLIYNTIFIVILPGIYIIRKMIKKFR